MKLQRILMVEPKNRTSHVYSRFALPRLGLPMLGGMIARQGYDVRVVIEEVAPLDPRELERVDLLCLSTLTATAPAAYALADRARCRGVPVVLGGAHPTALPDEALEHADWVIRGEAEHALPALLDALAVDGDLGAVPALSYRHLGEVVHNQPEATKVCLDELPAPDFDLIVGRDPERFHRGVIPVMTSRGCPHRCRFCSVTPIFGHKMRFASPEHVADQLERLRGQGEMVFFYDDNFCASPRRTKELLDFLLTNDVFLPPWIAQVSVRAARDQEMLQMMRRAGCHTVFVGFESVDDRALELYRKRQSTDDIRKAIRRFHAHDIGVHGMFVFGSDVEDLDTIARTTDFALEEQIDSLQFLVITPLPGTLLFDEMRSEGRLLTTDWSLYDTHHAVFQPRNMTPSELMSETFRQMGRFYSLRQTGRRLFRSGAKRAAISLYANRQVKAWQRENRPLLRRLRRAEGPRRSSLWPSRVSSLRQVFAAS